MKDKDISSLEHTSWRCQYHIVFAPKYRRMEIYGQIKQDNDLILTEKLWIYLADLNEQAQNRLHCIIAQMKETEEITEELKAQDQMAWVRAMNSIRNRAEEIVRHELIYDAKEVL